jgi:peptide chain release factor 3
VLAKSDGSHLALFPDQWRAKTVTRDHPDVMLEALPASTG